MDTALLRRPSALIPLAMSAAALATVVAYAALFGTARQADEGAAAHVWQLLMAGQVPVMARSSAASCWSTPTSSPARCRTGSRSRTELEGRAQPSSIRRIVASTPSPDSCSRTDCRTRSASRGRVA